MCGVAVVARCLGPPNVRRNAGALQQRPTGSTLRSGFERDGNEMLPGLVVSAGSCPAHVCESTVEMFAQGRQMLSRQRTDFYARPGRHL